MTAPVSVNLILQTVSVVFGVSIVELRSARRNLPALRARYAACLLARHLSGQSYSQVGRSIGMRDHTTIMAAVRRAEELHAADAGYRESYEAAKLAIINVSASSLANYLYDDDAREVAVRICDAPNSAHRASSREIIAMAVRLMTLEEVATDAFRLLSDIDRLSGVADQTNGGVLRASIQDHIANITERLISLGYVTPLTHSPSSGEVHV